MFQCVTVDNGNGSTESYLLADFTLTCNGSIYMTYRAIAVGNISLLDVDGPLIE
jgi:hypothetical protein